jgi:hypothetical protein
LIKIVLSAKDDDNKENTLRVTIDSYTSLVIFDSYTDKEYLFQTQKLDKLIVDYTENFGSGEFIQMRDLYNLLELSNKNKLNRDLARIFIISSRWMHFGQIPDFNNKEIIIKTIKDGINRFLNDFNILEWSGDTGNQPGIYFIKKEYSIDYKYAINKFYNRGLLYKYILDIDNEVYENYIFPFVEDNDTSIRKLDIIPYNNIWNKIIKDRNTDIINFVNGTRKRW